MITELLTTLKSYILQEIAKGIADLQVRSPISISHTKESPIDLLHTKGSTIYLPHTKQSSIALWNTKETPIALWNRMNSSIFPSIEIRVVLQYSNFQTQIEYQIEKEEEANRRIKLARANKKGKQQPVHKQPVRKVRR